MWRDITVRGHVATSKDRFVALFLLERENKFRIVAVESGQYDRTENVFDDHAHLDLGEFATLDDATTSAKKFVRKWRRKKKAAEKCDCGTIELNVKASKS